MPTTATATPDAPEPRPNLAAFGADTLQALGALERRLARSTLAAPLVELVRLRVSQINGCAYCTDRHARDARAAGVDERKLALLAAWPPTTPFTLEERAALGWAEALTRLAARHGPQDAAEQAAEVFGAEQLVDLTLLVTVTNAWNRLAIAARSLTRSAPAAGAG